MRRRVPDGLPRAAALVLAVAALLGAGGAGLAAPAGAAVPGGATADTSWTETRTITRDRLGADGTISTVDSRDVTVSVDRTQDLRGRERVQVAWSGARPSAARTTSPYGFDGMEQEYPVVVLQCRGVDDPGVPAARRVSPETCWTTTYMQRYAAASPASAVWRHDLYGDEEQLADQDAPGGRWPAACEKLPGSLLSQHVLPFRAASGAIYPSCDDTTIAPESAVDAALPAAELAAFTRADGTGSVQLEVRTATENESLGCAVDVPCTLVVIPIMGISCRDDDQACNADGAFEPGSSNFANVGVDDAVSPAYWWAASNWRNRFSVPLSFALPPDACDVLDDRAPVDMYGSELLNQASLQWAPAYCLRADRFKLRHNRLAEHAALRLLGTGEAAAAFVSEPSGTATGPPLGYAPVAVTGFAVAYVADLPDNAGEAPRLRLTPRLLAKLLTQSYPASASGRAHDGLADNPLTLNLDPEFVELNPGLSMTAEEVRATVLSLSEASDVLSAVTGYIAADAEAMAFVHGEPDPWGMRVNPTYRDIELPRAEWPLLDTFVREINRECERLNPSPYLGLVAAPVNSLRKIAEAVLDAWPNVQTQCTRSTSSDPWKFGRVARQGYGSRFMLGLVSLGDAERYGLRTAELRTAGTGAAATFVGATESSMAAALPAATQAAPGAAFTIDRAALAADAYPGTMIVHTAAPLTGAPPATAAQVAAFVRIATSEGQVRGSGNGALPAGYVPLVATGPTAPLHASAQVVAAAIEAQAGPVRSPDPGPTATPAATPAPVPAAGRAPVVTGPPPAAAPATADGLPAAVVAEDAPAGPTGTTMAQQSAVAAVAVPATAGVALAGLLGAPLLRTLSTRRRSS